jgi:hypothetical protein
MTGNLLVDQSTTGADLRLEILLMQPEECSESIGSRGTAEPK